MLEELEKNYNYAKIGTYTRRSASLVSFFRQDGLQNQPVLYTCAQPGSSEQSVLLDPNLLSADGTTSVEAVSFNRAATKLAYALADGGSDWRTIHVRDVASALDEADVLRWAKFTSIEWTHDDSGFYYNRFAAPPPKDGESEAESMAGAGRLTHANTGMRVYLHRLGTAQEEDELVFEMGGEDDKAMLSLEVVDEGRFLCLVVRKGKFNQIWVRRTADPPPPASAAAEAEDGAAVDAAVRWGFTRLVSNYEAKWELLTTDGSSWLFFTNAGAPRYHIVAIDIEEALAERAQSAAGGVGTDGAAGAGAPLQWRVIVPESEHTLGGGDYAKGGHCVGGHLLLKYMNHVKDELHQYSLDGTFECVVQLPELGVISAITGRKEHTDAFFRFESFLTPPVIYRYTPSTREPPEAVMRTEVHGLDTSGFLIEQKFATSKDGTQARARPLAPAMARAPSLQAQSRVEPGANACCAAAPTAPARCGLALRCRSSSCAPRSCCSTGRARPPSSATAASTSSRRSLSTRSTSRCSSCSRGSRSRAPSGRAPPRGRACSSPCAACGLSQTSAAAVSTGATGTRRARSSASRTRLTTSSRAQSSSFGSSTPARASCSSMALPTAGCS